MLATHVAPWPTGWESRIGPSTGPSTEQSSAVQSSAEQCSAALLVLQLLEVTYFIQVTCSRLLVNPFGRQVDSRDKPLPDTI